MPDNVAILLVILVAANVVLIGVVLGRTASGAGVLPRAWSPGPARPPRPP